MSEFEQQSLLMRKNLEDLANLQMQVKSSTKDFLTYSTRLKVSICWNLILSLEIVCQLDECITSAFSCCYIIINLEKFMDSILLEA